MIRVSIRSMPGTAVSGAPTQSSMIETGRHAVHGGTTIMTATWICSLAMAWMVTAILRRFTIIIVMEPSPELCLPLLTHRLSNRKPLVGAITIMMGISIYL